MARWSRNCHGLVQVFCYFCQADCVAALGLLGLHYSLSGDLLSRSSRGQHASLLYSLFSLAQALPIGTRSYRSMYMNSPSKHSEWQVPSGPISSSQLRDDLFLLFSLSSLYSDWDTIECETEGTSRRAFLSSRRVLTFSPLF